MKCFLDLDGVLIDFMKGAHKFHNLPYSYEDYPYELANWDTCPPPNGRMSTRQFWDNLDHDFWANLKWMPDGKDILTLVENNFNTEDICILTSPTFHPGSISGKIEWIKTNIPQYKRQYLVGPGKDFCASKDHILIDDRDKNLEDFTKEGGLSIPVPRKWNSFYEEDTYSFVEEMLENAVEMANAA